MWGRNGILQDRFPLLRVLLPFGPLLSQLVMGNEGERRRQPLSAVTVTTCASQPGNAAAGLGGSADPFRSAQMGCRSSAKLLAGERVSPELQQSERSWK